MTAHRTKQQVQDAAERGGTRPIIADRLQISPRTLYRLIHKYGLTLPRATADRQRKLKGYKLLIFKTAGPRLQNCFAIAAAYGVSHDTLLRERKRRAGL